MFSPSKLRTAVLAGALATALPAGHAAHAADGSNASTAPDDAVAGDLAVSLTPSGREAAAAVDWLDRPNYQLFASVSPADGEVSAALVAELPVGAGAASAELRWFPGVAAASATVSGVAVDGALVDATVDASLITVPLPDGHGDQVTVELDFAFIVPEISTAPMLSLDMSDGLQPVDIGLLGRSDNMLMLGHWFPIWLPDGASAAPELDGYGDIANFPAATITATVEVPAGSTVVSGGSRLDEKSGSDTMTITEGGIGLRDLAITVLSGAEQLRSTAGDVEIVVTAPPGTADADLVAEIAVTSIEVLSASFGAYPWAEVDVVATPLGAGVAGMEFPGMIWIEPSIFAGGVPGLDDLGFGDVGLGDLGELSDILGELEDLGLDGLFDGLFGGSFEDLMLQVETMREWVVAHEIAHLWWHSLVGNDSISAPVVDEPLAQHAACLVFRELRPRGSDAVCDAHTSGQYLMLRSMGAPDTAANQPAAAFASSLQYGAVVYGKAPLFYRALEDTYGVAATTAALASVVAEHMFEQITPDELRDGLGLALDDPDGVGELWTRWMEEAHGDTDVT